MFLIVFLHANYLSLGDVDFLSNGFHDLGTNLFRMFLEQFCVVGVNVFVMISGWFSIKPNIKGGCSLIFQVLFWHLFLFCFIWIMTGERPLLHKEVLYMGAYYWFIVAYFILYCFSPVLNIFALYAKKNVYKYVLVLFFANEFIYGWLWSDFGNYNSGYSAFSFVGLYLLMQYVRKYHSKIMSVSRFTYVLFFLLFTIMPVLFELLSCFIFRCSFSPLWYNSPFVICASFSFFMIFVKGYRYNKFINNISLFILPVYLIHISPYIFPYFKSFMMKMYVSSTGIIYMLSVVLVGVFLCLVSVIFDKIRYIIWMMIMRLLSRKFISK